MRRARALAAATAAHRVTWYVPPAVPIRSARSDTNTNTHWETTVYPLRLSLVTTLSKATHLESTLSHLFLPRIFHGRASVILFAKSFLSHTDPLTGLLPKRVHAFDERVHASTHLTGALEDLLTPNEP